MNSFCSFILFSVLQGAILRHWSTIRLSHGTIQLDCCFLKGTLSRDILLHQLQGFAKPQWLESPSMTVLLIYHLRSKFGAQTKSIYATNVCKNPIIFYTDDDESVMLTSTFFSFANWTWTWQSTVFVRIAGLDRNFDILPFMTNGILVSQVILAPALIDALLFYVVVVEKLCAKLVVMATGSSLLVLFVAVWLSTASGVPHHRREINGNGPLQNGLFESKYVSLVMLGSMAVKSKLKLC